jgi:hypothetical protein
MLTGSLLGQALPSKMSWGISLGVMLLKSTNLEKTFTDLLPERDPDLAATKDTLGLAIWLKAMFLRRKVRKRAYRKAILRKCSK